MNCPDCGHANGAGADRCAECARDLPRNCRSCGVPLPDDLPREAEGRCERCRDDDHAAPADDTGREGSDEDEAAAPVAPINVRAGFRGRGEQLDRLRDRFVECRDAGHLHFVTVTGEAGMGVTRFAEESRAALGEVVADALILYGAAADAAAAPYPALVRMLETLFGIEEGEAPHSARDKILDHVASNLRSPQATEVAHFLGQLMRYPFPESEHVQPLTDSPMELEMHMYLALRRLFEAEAATRPVALFFDEMDLASPETVRIVHYLADALAKHPVLLVALGRPGLLDLKDDWGEGDYAHERIELPPLSPDDTEALVSDLVWRAPLPEALRGVVRTGLGGNPRAAEELVRYLVEAEVARPTAAGPFGFDRETLEGLAIPTGYEEILWARLRALPPDERDLVEKAAAVGRRFWLDGVVALVRTESMDHGDLDGPPLAEIAAAGDRGRADVARGLARLGARGLIEEQKVTQIPGEREYHFVGPVAGLAYDMLSQGRRARYHRIVAQWLELRPGLGEDHQHEVARHLERAGDGRTAAERYRRAADAARARYFNHRAVRLYEDALRCAGDDVPLRIGLWHDLGSVCELTGDYDRALAAFERVLRLSWVFASRAKGGVALNKMGRIWRRKGELAHALDYLEKGLQLFEQQGDDRGVATSLDDIGYALWLRGDYDAALDHTGRGLEIRREFGDARSIAQSLTNIGNIQKDRGLLDEAESCHQEALAIRRKVGDRAGVALSLNYLGVLRQERGRFDEAQEMIEEALREAQAIGALPLQALLLTNLGDIAVRQDDAAAAREHLERGLAIGRDISSRRILSAAHRSLGLLDLRLGNPERARESCETALRIAEKGGIRDLVGRALVALGEVEASTLFDSEGDDEAGQRAEAHLSRAADLFREIHNDAELGRALHRLGQLTVERGDEEKGHELLGEAQEIFDRLGIREGDEVRDKISKISIEFQV